MVRFTSEYLPGDQQSSKSGFGPKSGRCDESGPPRQHAKLEVRLTAYIIVQRSETLPTNALYFPRVYSTRNEVRGLQGAHRVRMPAYTAIFTADLA